MERTTAKRLFVSALTSLDDMIPADQTLVDWIANHNNRPADDEDLDLSEVLDSLGEELWGCHEVIDLSGDVLDIIGCEPGVTFHDAVLCRAVEWLTEHEENDRTMVRKLHGVFVKDQRGRHGEAAPVDRATFKGWLSGYMPDEVDALMRLWGASRQEVNRPLDRIDLSSSLQ